jgi:hypothetical protein
MKLRINRTMSGVLAAAIMASGTLAAIAPAQAYTGNPPWVLTDANNHGGIKIYDVAGNEISGGNDYNVLGSFFAGQGTSKRVCATKANLYVAVPDHNVSIPLNWYNASLQGSTVLSTAPAAPTAVGPVIGKTNWGSPTIIDDLLSGGTLDTSSAAYTNVFELRMYDSGLSGCSQGANYWAADIQYNPAALGGASYDGLAPQAWRVVYPVSTKTQATISTPVPSATGTYTAGQQITLDATASVAGLIQFTEDGTNIGSPVSVTTSPFTGTSAAITLPAGDHLYAASFTPTDTANYNGATSLDLALSVNGATTTVSQPVASTLSPLTAGSSITLTSTATAGVPGSIRFKDNGNTITGVPAVAVDNSGAATSAAFQPAAGNHSYTAVFTPTDYIGYSQSTSTALAYVVNALAPTSQTSVATTGGHVVDQTLTCVNGTWSNSPTSFTYAWLLNGSTISGKITNQLPLTAAMVGKNVICRVTARNLGGTGYDDSTPVAVAKATFKNTKLPVISGVLRVGQLLKVTAGTWSKAGTSYTYQWKRNGVAIRGATKNSYKTTAADKRKSLTVTVTAKRAGYYDKPATSLKKKIS